LQYGCSTLAVLTRYWRRHCRRRRGSA
jgi:hypothetical protein